MGWGRDFEGPGLGLGGMLSRQREPKVYRPGDRCEPEDSGEARTAGA